MHAFIVRPFGIKNGIDFDRVDRELISPALDHFNISGGTVGLLRESRLLERLWAFATFMQEVRHAARRHRKLEKGKCHPSGEL